ncbi:hypothetical protein SAMN04487946_11615 [Halobellus clavatus]|uniref:Uncharacterized protein n=1 Tax=Halobellus clavatus TaxID=660517 RepID=A0A1H3JXD3_9EURY|nr:hypothetical protein SAMN04487946_11615 [Halobellus clavatus]
MLEIARLTGGSDGFELGFVERGDIRVRDEDRYQTPSGWIITFRYRFNSQ